MLIKKRFRVVFLFFAVMVFFIFLSLKVISNPAAPVVTLTSPTNGETLHASVTLVCNTTADTYLTNLSVYHNFSGTFLLNKTVYFGDISLTDNTIALWHLDNNTNDETGRHNLLLQGSTNCSTSVSGIVAENTSCDFNSGTTDFLNTTDSSNVFDLNKSNLTFVVWIRPTKVGEIIFLTKGNSAGCQWEYYLEKIAGETIRFSMENSSCSITSFTTTQKVRLNEWNFVALVKNLTDVTIYINETSQNFSIPATHQYTLENNNAFVIGGAPTWNYYDGMVDEVVIYNRTLSTAEIVAIYKERTNSLAEREAINYSFNYTGIADSTYIWNCLAFDNTSQSAFASSNYTFTVDFDWNPTITLVEPLNNAYLPYSNVSFTFNLSDDWNIENVSIYHNVSGTFSKNKTAHYGLNINSNTIGIWNFNNDSLDLNRKNNGTNYNGTYSPGKVGYALNVSNVHLTTISVYNSGTLTANGSYASFPSMVNLSNGDIIVVYKIGPDHNTNIGNAIYYSRSTDNGLTWDGPNLIYNNVSERNIDPGITIMNNSGLLVSFISGNPPRGQVMKSTDNGQTWVNITEVGDLTKSPYTWSAARRAITLPDGTLLMGFCGSNSSLCSGTYAAYVMNSSNYGETWDYRSTAIYDSNCSEGTNYSYEEPALLYVNGSILMVSRSNRNATVSWSYDNGTTWTAGQPLDCGGTGKPHLLQLDNSDIILTFREGEANSIIMSYNNGSTWDCNNESVLWGYAEYWGDHGYSENVQINSSTILSVFYHDANGNGTTTSRTITVDLTGRYFTRSDFLSSDPSKYFNMTDSALMYSRNYTIEMWINPTEINALEPNFLLHQYMGEQFKIKKDGKLYFRLYNVTAVDNSITSNSTIPINTWTHVAATYNGSEYRLYINGVLDSTLTASGTPTDTWYQWQIGVRNGITLRSKLLRGVMGFSGLIDEFAMFNRSLSATEINEHYNTRNATNSTSDSINITNIPDGVYIWNIETYDNKSQSNISSSNLTFTVDTVKPTASLELSSTSIESPATVSIKCSGTDATAGINKTNVTITLPNGMISSSNTSESSNNYTFSDTTNAGTYSVDCNITDRAGNSQVARLNFSITTSTAGGTSGGSLTSPTNIKEVSISEKENTKVEMRIGEMIGFSIGDNKHYTTLVKIGFNSVTLRIESAQKEVTVFVGQEVMVDINNDNYNELYIKLNSITGNKADLILKEIHEKVVSITEKKEEPKLGEEPEKVKELQEEGKTGLSLSLSFKYVILLILAIVVVVYYLITSKLKTRKSKY